MPSNGGPRQVRFAVPASPTVKSPTFTLGSMPPTMDRSGSRSPPPSMDVAELNRDLPQVRSPGWRLVMRQVLAEDEYDFGFRATGPRPSDQHQWNADDLASLRHERMGRELERELSMAADLWAANEAAFEAAARAGAYGFADDDPITIGEMLQRRFYDNHPTGGDSPASVNGMDSDEDYDSDLHSHLAFGTECEAPTSSTSSVDFEGAPETHRLSLEIPVAHSAAEIMSDSAGSDADYMSDSSPISIPDPEVQPSTPMSDATDDSEWLPTESSDTTSESDMDYASDTDESTTSEATDDSQWATTASSATTPGSGISQASDTDDNLLTFDDLTNIVDAIYALVGADSYAREAFLTFAYILVSHVDEEFDNVQIDYLATRLQNFQNDGKGENPILFIADLCRVLGLLGEDGRIPPDVFGS
ncbi:hypothetical protein KC340_g2372 [Hortaea werneckii]|nr:hypothetical protein KC342_g497 [Hortaea werneckii]KAI7107265.1 hypothetical protein KC339_g2526 [Hortaea werneckii]KAI7212657.1 hypothetical protein KC365_g14541 [Hortaea werneckii]KAI7334718.1 hypothetical protein KC340_g2372 [Hortaea werneckii]KAI7398635.1 hypothetical protein KC328_g4370 [Hortaea werneckii]